MRVQMLICSIVCDVDPDHPGDVAEPVFQALEKFSTEMIVLPKSYNPFSGVERLRDGYSAAVRAGADREAIALVLQR